MLFALLLASTDAQGQKFVATGAMHVSRYGHTAVLLRDGDVLLAGGSDGKVLLSSAELYDPHERAFHLTGSMHTARRDAAGVLLPDGDVLIAGGHDASGHPLRSAEIYNPKAGTFHPAGDLEDPLEGIVAFRLHNGTVLLFGRSRCERLIPVCTDSVEIYSPMFRTFVRAGDLPQGSGSEGFAAALLHNDDLLAIGGYLPVGIIASANAELYFPQNETSRFTRGASLFDEYGATAVVLKSGEVLVAGGGHYADPPTVTELYHPSLDSFTRDGMMNLPFVQRLTLLRDGTVLATGGGDGVKGAEIYHPASHSFQLIGSMLSGRIGDTSTLLKDGSVLLAGGIDPSRSTYPNQALTDPSAEIFIPFSFDLRSGVSKKQVADDSDWIAFTIFVDGNGPDDQRIELTCRAKHLDCDAWPDDVMLGGKSYVIIHGLSGVHKHSIPVWVQGTAGSETRTIRLTIEKP